MNIDLTQYVVARWGDWSLDKASFTPNELRLGNLRDGVTLAGPLCIRVSVRARNHFTLYGTSAVALQERDVFSYKLEIPPGQTWTYPAPRALQLDPAAAAALAAANPLLGPVLAAQATAAAADTAALYQRDTLWGANAGFGVAIRACGPEACADPCAPEPCRPIDPCAPPKKECGCSGGCGGGGCSGGSCGCECGGQGHPDDLPCNFATGRGAPVGMFFPAACEPCAPGAFVGMPPAKGPSLMVPSARGGTVRTRYFNGMFITKEDLWTDQNNNRLKHALMNRAMGQGVVWGFDVGFDGETVCVLPGYGVDCCGNDIVVSSAYRVDAQMLLRDPAAAPTLAMGGAKRMNLLLEYFECPEEPRPVHGDPCAPESSRCEMSRIRETARLRLVPPIEIDDSGCIKDFLNEVKRLKGDPVTGPLINTPPPGSFMPMPIPTPMPAPAPVPVPAPLPAPIVPLITQTAPFKLVFTSAAGQKTMAPLPFPPPGHDSIGLSNTADMEIAVKPDTGATFLPSPKTMVNLTAGPGAPKNDFVVLAPNGGAWKTRVGASGGVTTVAFDVNWSVVRASDGSRFDGFTTITLSRRSDDTNVSIDVTGRATLTVAPPPPPSDVPQPPHPTSDVPQPPTPAPPAVRISCLSEACDPEGRRRFPIELPWLHEDPSKPGQAADPKVIILAILYAVSVSQIAQSGPGITPEVIQAQEALAKGLNAGAWSLFYQDVPDDQRLAMMDALKRLFQCWCKSLLYPGPRCECGCGPHGVVVGCALVDGGTLRMVDPWGGRRWVVHYPLLAYWGKQFGIAPPDALASKFFDLICCVAHTYPSRGSQVLKPGAPPALNTMVNRAPVVPLHASALIFDQPANVPAHLAHAGVTPEQTLAVSPMDFISRVIEALSATGGPPAPGAAFVHYTVNGIPELNFVTPAVPAAAPPAGAPASAGGSVAGAQPQVPASSVGSPSPLSDLVRSAIASRKGQAAVPALLRLFAETLTRGLLASVPIDASTGAARALRDALVRADIRSLGALLDRDPDSLHVGVLNRADAAGLAALLEAGEKTAASVAKTVGDLVQKMAAEGRLVSRDDLRAAALVTAFTKALTEALKGALPEPTVAAAVYRASGNAG